MEWFLLKLKLNGIIYRFLKFILVLPCICIIFFCQTMHNICFTSLSNRIYIIIYQHTETNVEKNIEEGHQMLLECECNTKYYLVRYYSLKVWTQTDLTDFKLIIILFRE